MFQWIARLVVGRRLAVLLAAGVFVVVGVLWGTSAFGRLAAGGFDDPGSQSTLAAQRISAELGQHAPDVLVLYSSRSATVNTAVLPPMPKAKVATATAVKTGFRRRKRRAYRASPRMPVMGKARRSPPSMPRASRSQLPN